MSSDRTGFTTGTCAAVATKAATMVLCGMVRPEEVDVTLPNGSIVTLPLAMVGGNTTSAWASVKKDAGDDPDVTDGCLVSASVGWTDDNEIIFLAGEGVGTVTKPGLSVPPGEPAINPVPRRMIMNAVRDVTRCAVRVTISIPGGKELAQKTFNPRLGVEGGLSILGTSGIVRPFSSAALQDALKCALNVAVACNVKAPVFVPGRIGEKAVRKLFRPSSEQVVEVSNEWGFMLDRAMNCDFDRLLILGHPGKLAKLTIGYWDTHSSRSGSAVPAVMDLAGKIFGQAPPERSTVEGVFRELDTTDQKKLADVLAANIRQKVASRILNRFEVAVVLVNMTGGRLGQDGDTSAWQ
ncbi:MAG: cobalt-precorrin-5B (C(1))-methyltransferase CbiD [Desulfomonilaceae bacterium]